MAITKEAKRLYDAARYREKREETLARVTEYQREHPEVNVAARERYRDKNRAERRAANSARYHRHPEKWSQYASTRRARKRGTQVGKIDYTMILAEHGMTCHLCGQAIQLDNLHFDHVIPLSRGGAHVQSNVRPAHAMCNWRKGSKLLQGDNVTPYKTLALFKEE